MTEQDLIQQLTTEGFKKVIVCPCEPNMQLGEHTHEEPTVHIITKGELIIHDDAGEKRFHTGDRVEFPAGAKHTAEAGPEGFTMVVGIKK